ncbi:MAG: ABC transporter ATP-binding protein [Clostridium perfringens]|nr:ABC transporter ATP-binding protein [Clostridium perfringens]
MKALEVKNLKKSYGNFMAVNNLSFSISEGDIFGLLGPNGAGKSTTMSMICGILKPDMGSINVLGKDLFKERMSITKEIGFVPQNIALYENYTAYENAKFFGKIYGLRGKKLEEAINKALEFTGLLEVKNKRAGEFSGGMMRRLNIACAIIHSPKLIIMDEPTVGIDPQSRNHILESVKKLNKKGATIIYTTHYMEEVESICNNIAIIDSGKIIASGTCEELKEKISDDKILNIRIENDDFINKDLFKDILGVKDIKIYENNIRIVSDRDIYNLDEIIKVLKEKDIKILDIKFEVVDLETVFLTFTGKKLRD